MHHHTFGWVLTLFTNMLLDLMGNTGRSDWAHFPRTCGIFIIMFLRLYHGITVCVWLMPPPINVHQTLTEWQKADLHTPGNSSGQRSLHFPGFWLKWQTVFFIYNDRCQILHLWRVLALQLCVVPHHYFCISARSVVLFLLYALVCCKTSVFHTLQYSVNFSILYSPMLDTLCYLIQIKILYTSIVHTFPIQFCTLSTSCNVCWAWKNM